MQLGGVVSSVVIGFLGGSLIRLFTGPLIELPNFSEVEVKPTQRVIFVPKRTEEGNIQYVLSRVEEADKPFVPSGDFSMTPEEWEVLVRQLDQLKNGDISNADLATSR
jgi:hypothetical protein